MGENLLIDTNVIIDALRGYKPAISFIEKLNAINVSVVTAGELVFGCKNSSSQKKVIELLEQYNIEEITQQISKKSFDLVKEYHLKYGITLADAQIGATCLVLGYSLVTRDLKHFSPIAGLKVVSMP